MRAFLFALLRAAGIGAGVGRRPEAPDRRRLQAGGAGADAGVREADRPQGHDRERHRRRAGPPHRAPANISTSWSCRRDAGAAARQPGRREQRQAAGPRRHRCRRSSRARRCPTSPRSSAFKQTCSRRAPSPMSIRRRAAPAGIYLASLFEKMGIAAELKPKTVLVNGGLAGEKLVSGEAESRCSRRASCYRAGHGAGRADPARVQNYTSIPAR